MSGDDFERRIERAIASLTDEIATLRRDAGTEIARLRKDVQRVTEFQVGFRALSKVMTFLLAAATTGAALYGAFWRR